MLNKARGRSRPILRSRAAPSSMDEQAHALNDVQVEKLHNVIDEEYVVSGGFSFPSLHLR